MCNNEERLYRGQHKKYDNCLFVPSALRGYSSQYKSRSLSCCTDCNCISIVEELLQGFDIETNLYKNKCYSLSKNGRFQNCDKDIPYIFWISIVYCEHKFSHMGIPTSFSGNGCVKFPIWNDTTLVNGANTIEEYAFKIVKYYFECVILNEQDNFLRIYAEHQHYYKKCCGYDLFPKMYRLNNKKIIDTNTLPVHFTLLLDWTECIDTAKEFSGENGTIVSISSKKYDEYVGSNFKISYKNLQMQYSIVDTIKEQKSVLTFWPWAYTIDELLSNQLGKALDFKLEQ